MGMKARRERNVVSGLGPAGLRRALDDLLDAKKLVRLANACGLRYPGMRTQSQKRDRLLRDLAERTGTDEAAAKAVYRALAKETVAAARQWARLSGEDQLRRLRDPAFLSADGNVGRLLFLVASSPPEGVDAAKEIGRLASWETGTTGTSPGLPEPADLARELARWKKRLADLRKKLRHVETQLARSRESEKNLKRDLIQRKGELAESRMLSERLRRELEEVRGRKETREETLSSPSDERIAGLAREVRRMATGHRKLAHAVEKLAEAATRKDTPKESDEGGPAALRRSLEQVQKELASLRRERKKDRAEEEKRMEAVRAEIRAFRGALEPATPRRRTGRRKGEPERVGVFIDVQNMYYAARKLKGKLDFDAMLQAAVRDRRLVLARAYVVESADGDQSGFLALLRQRGIDVRSKPLQVRADGSMKGDWDMEMALEILDAVPRLDVVVLVSGDGDFTSLVNRVKGMGPTVEVVGFPRNTAKSLQQAADRFLGLDRKFMIRSEPGSTRSRRARGAGPAADGKGS